MIGPLRAVAERLAHAMADPMFARPSGVLGRLGGMIMASSNAATERAAADALEPCCGEDVLVLGAGPGVGVALLLPRVATVVAIDPSKEMLEACRRRAVAIGAAGRLVTRRGSDDDLGQDEATVDAVVAVNNLQLWSDRDAGLAAVRRVLRPGGRLVLSVHRWMLDDGLSGLAASTERAGFTAVRTWTWDPPGVAAPVAAQLHAVAPPA